MNIFSLKIYTLVFIIMPLLIKCNAQNTKVYDESQSDLLSQLTSTSWILTNIEDRYNYDSIPVEDLGGKKVLKFKNDTIKEYFYPSKKLSRSMFFEIDSNKMYIKSGSQIIQQYNFEVFADSLIIMRQGRHGKVKEYYAAFKKQ